MTKRLGFASPIVVDTANRLGYSLYMMTQTTATAAKVEAVKFNKHHVTNGTVKARVHYCLDNRTDGRKCVTMYAKDYSDNLLVVLGDIYQNDTDFQTDYFDKGKAVLFETHPLYAAARVRVEQLAKN